MFRFCQIPVHLIKKIALKLNKEINLNEWIMYYANISTKTKAI